MKRSPRSELLAIQKKLFRHNQRLIAASVHVREPGFQRYESAYRRATARYTHISSIDEMFDAVLASDIIYVGDYHTCNQSQRSLLRLLKAVVKRDRNIAIGLELVHARHQKVLDAYLSGSISEATFLRRIRLQEHWVFDLWPNFKPLFDFCRYHRLPMLAIDAAPVGSPLRVRDRASAKLIARFTAEHPKRKLFVSIGDLHVAPANLPSDVQQELRRLKIARQPLILYQNSETIYWKLAAKGLDDRVEVVRINANSFCRMHTPPVICQRSYLNWLEHEEGEIDYADARHSFLELVEHISRFIRLRLPKRELESVEVFTAGDLSFLKRLRQLREFNAAEIRDIKQQIMASESYYIAKARFVYLANLSINHAAEEAAHFIKSAISGVEQPRDLVDAFYANILHEALGFWGSKIINHKRKCFHENDFRSLLSYLDGLKRIPPGRMLERQTAQLVLEYVDFEKRGMPLSHPLIFGVHRDVFLAVTHALGYMLGDRMYYGLMSGAISRKEVRALFQDPWRDEGEPFRAYWTLRKQLKSVKIPKRV